MIALIDLVIAAGIIGAIILANRLTLDPREIENRTRGYRTRLADLARHRRPQTTKGKFVLVAVALLILLYWGRSLGMAALIALVAIGIFAVLVMLRVLFHGESAQAAHPAPPLVPPLDAVPHARPVSISMPMATAATPPEARRSPRRPRRPSGPSHFDNDGHHSWAGGFVRTLGMLALLASGVAFMLIASGEVSTRWDLSDSEEKGRLARRYDPRLLELPRRGPRVTSVAINGKNVVVGQMPTPPAVPPAPHQIVVQEHRPIELPLSDRKGGDRITILTEPSADGAQCYFEALERISESLPQILEVEGIKTEGWMPPPQWVADHMILHKELTPDVENKLYRARVDLSLARSELEKLRQRFYSDRSADRSIRLLKTYIGTVLVLGGLSIFLRLGTGRRPPA